MFNSEPNFKLCATYKELEDFARKGPYGHTAVILTKEQVEALLKGQYLAVILNNEYTAVVYMEKTGKK